MPGKIVFTAVDTAPIAPHKRKSPVTAGLNPEEEGRFGFLSPTTVGAQSTVVGVG